MADKKIRVCAGIKDPVKTKKEKNKKATKNAKGK